MGPGVTHDDRHLRFSYLIVQTTDAEVSHSIYKIIPRTFSIYSKHFFFKNLRDKEILEQNAYFLLKARPFQGAGKNYLQL